MALWLGNEHEFAAISVCEAQAIILQSTYRFLGNLLVISENGDESSRRFKLVALGRRDLFTLGWLFCGVGIEWDLEGLRVRILLVRFENGFFCPQIRVQ